MYYILEDLPYLEAEGNCGYTIYNSRTNKYFDWRSTLEEILNEFNYNLLDEQSTANSLKEFIHEATPKDNTPSNIKIIAKCTSYKNLRGNYPELFI